MAKGRAKSVHLRGELGGDHIELQPLELSFDRAVEVRVARAARVVGLLDGTVLQPPDPLERSWARGAIHEFDIG